MNPVAGGNATFLDANRKTNFLFLFIFYFLKIISVQVQYEHTFSFLFTAKPNIVPEADGDDGHKIIRNQKIHTKKITKKIINKSQNQKAGQTPLIPPELSST